MTQLAQSARHVEDDAHADRSADAGGDRDADRQHVRLSIWQRFSFAIMRSLVRAHARVWGLDGVYTACRVFGTLEYLVNYKRRRRVAEMLERVFERALAPAERRRLVRAHFMRERCDKTFYLILDKLSTEEAKARFTIVNRHLLDDALARGRGLYGMLSHHGPHHVTALIMGLFGYRVGGLRDPNEGAMRRYIQDLWERHHPDLPRAKILYAGDFVRPVYRLFKENYAIGSALDVTRVRDQRLKTVPVNIFGETRAFLTGTLQIALRCKTPVVQSFIVSEDNFHYRLEMIGPLVDPDHDEESPELIQRIMQQYADNIAEFARRYPDHVTRV